jgi:hypothetical protein
VRIWQVSGPGSRLLLPNLVSILSSIEFGGTGTNGDLQIQALNGGVIDLSQVAEIADPVGSSTNQFGNQFLLSADGLGSLIDLSALTQLID